MTNEKNIIKVNQEGIANVTINEKKENVIRSVDFVNELAVKAPIKINLKGVISAPREFLMKRLNLKNQVSVERTHVLVSRENLSLTLIYNENDEYNVGQIKGMLEQHPKFKEFKINSNVGWEPNELGQFFKMNRAFFPDKAKNMDLVTQLKNFEASVNSKIELQKSEKGDFKDSYSGVVNSNIPESFTLSIPLFKGSAPEVIEVEFYASVNGREVSLQLFSPGATQAVEEVRDEVIDKEVQLISEFAPEIVIIEQ